MAAQAETGTAQAETGTAQAETGTAQARLALALAQVTPLVARSRAAAIALWERLRPALLAAIARARTATASVARRAGPAARDALARSGALAGRFVTIARARLEARAATQAAATTAQKPRRTTAAPPAAAAPGEWRTRKGAQTEPAPAPARRPIGRYIVLAGAAVSALAFGTYAFSGDDAETLDVPTVPGAAGAPAAPSAPTSSATPAPPVGALPAAQAFAPPTPAAPAGPVAIPTPAALAAPTYVAGSLPAPTYPTLQPTARPAVAPAGVPTASPYAVDVRAESVAGHDPTLRAPMAPGAQPAAPAAAPTAAPATPAGTREFGDASVTRGQTFTLRMSQEVAGLSGRRDPAGFDLRIDGALTLDRAAPIAATHPAVATAMIINRGDHADLAIRFREGMAPAYHVVARGAALEITIARR